MTKTHSLNLPPLIMLLSDPLVLLVLLAILIIITYPIYRFTTNLYIDYQIQSKRQKKRKELNNQTTYHHNKKILRKKNRKQLIYYTRQLKQQYSRIQRYGYPLYLSTIIITYQIFI